MVVVLPPPRLPRLGLSPPIEDCAAAAASAAAAVTSTFVVVLLPAPPPRLPRLPLSPPGASSSCLYRLNMDKQFAWYRIGAECCT